MAAIRIRSFGGISPRVPARYLQDGQAQIALNCPAFSGSLVPLPDVSAAVHTLAKSGVPQTIYRFGEGIQSDTLYWFSWSADVDVVRGPVAGDTSERTYLTGAAPYPQVTNNALALPGGTQYPLASYRLGVPAPATPLIAVVSGTASDGALSETRAYAYTWVNGFDEESAPSPAAELVNVKTGQTVTLTGFESAPAGEWNLKSRRIYRSASGTYLFVAEIPAAANTFADAVLGDDLGESMPSLNWDAPPSGLTGLVGLPNGLMAGFVGRDVYFSDPYHPFAWPESYVNTVDYPIVGLGRMDTTLAVLTKGMPYFIQGTHPESMAVVKSDIEQACVSKQSIISVGGAVVYASPDGLVMLSPGGSRIVTEALFTRDQWQAFNPSSIRAFQHDLKYLAFYDTGTVKGGFILDLATGVFILHDIHATAGYSDLQSDTLYLAFSDRTVKKWATGAPKTMTWRSKKFSAARPSGLTCAQLEAEGYPVTLNIYADGVLKLAKSVPSREAFRLPSVEARDWEFEIIGSKEIFSLVAATSMAELANG